MGHAASHPPGSESEAELTHGLGWGMGGQVRRQNMLSTFLHGVMFRGLLVSGTGSTNNRKQKDVVLYSDLWG